MVRQHVGDGIDKHNLGKKNLTSDGPVLSLATQQNVPGLAGLESDDHILHHTVPVPMLVPAEGAILAHILDTMYPRLHQGLTRRAFRTLDSALRRTDWARRHYQRFALMDGSDVLASAELYDLTGVLSDQHLSVRGIASICLDPTGGDDDTARQLVEGLVQQAVRDRVDAAVLFGAPDALISVLDGFEVLPTVDVVLNVAEPSRYGAPMTLVRGGEDRDLAAIVAMGQVRADGFRFHLERDTDLVKYAITRKRLLAGLGASGERQLHFMIAEEGITAAAYVVISIIDGTWTIEECGDRDASGARVGALLQALIAREPAERRPVIRGWLPPGFVPPQVTIGSTFPSEHVIAWRLLRARTQQLSVEDVLYWRSDLF
jgi:hypothetical protein